jgi:aerobic carbon-monoxide dehydrogenase small subunit
MTARPRAARDRRPGTAAPGGPGPPRRTPRRTPRLTPGRTPGTPRAARDRRAALRPRRPPTRRLTRLARRNRLASGGHLCQHARTASRPRRPGMHPDIPASPPADGTHRAPSSRPRVTTPDMPAQNGEGGRPGGRVAHRARGERHAPGGDVEPRRLLVQVIRDDLGLTGTHVGCDTSQCGACTVHVDGKAVKSCAILAVQADGGDRHDDRGDGRRRDPPPAPAGVLGEARPPVRLLHAGDDHGRGRPARPRPDPTDEEIRHAIEGNICRCTGYQNIVAAIRRRPKAMRCGRLRP